MKKRFRSLVVLATMVALVLSMSGIAFAQFSDVAKDAPYATHVELLNSLGIAKGYPDGTFGVNQPMTRQEFAVFVVRAMGKERLAEGFANTPTGFKDDKQIGDWARGAVYLASQMGIIAGYPDGTFKPQGNVTQAEALTMLVRALGFKKYAEDLGAWPVGYLLAAEELGITQGLTVFPNVPMVRSEMAIALANTLFATTAKNNDGSPNKDKIKDTAWIRTVWNKNYDRAVGNSGKVEAITLWNNSITIGGKTFTYATDVKVAINRDITAEWEKDDPNLKKIEDVKVGDVVEYLVDTENKITRINIVYWNVKNAKLTGVTVDSNNAKIDVDNKGKESRSGLDIKGAQITIDGQTANATDLKNAFNNSGKNVLVSIRIANTRGGLADVSATNQIVEVAAITNKIVSGKVTGYGTDLDGSYALIDGQKVYYSTVYGINQPSTGNTVKWLLGTDGVAYLSIGVAGPTLPAKYDALYAGTHTDAEGKTVHTFQFADGTTRSVSTAEIDTANCTVGEVCFWNGSKFYDVTDGTNGNTSNDLNQTTVAKRSTGLLVGTSVKALASYGVWVKTNSGDLEKYDEWTPDDDKYTYDVYYNSYGEVDYIVEKNK